MSNIGEQVIADIRKQEEKGLKTYGVTVDRDDYELLNWLEEAYFECIDNCIYLRAAINKLKNGTQRLTYHQEANQRTTEQDSSCGEANDLRASL